MNCHFSNLSWGVIVYELVLIILSAATTCLHDRPFFIGLVAVTGARYSLSFFLFSYLIIEMAAVAKKLAEQLKSKEFRSYLMRYVV